MGKSKFLLSFAILSCSATSLGAAIALRSQAIPAFAEGTTLNITTETGVNSNAIFLNVDATLPEITTHDITWYVNGAPYLASVNGQAAGGTSLRIAWNGSDSTKSYGKCDEREGEGKRYCHYRIPAGTVIADNLTLQEDYNFWFTHQSGGADNHTWAFQHGGTDAVWNAEVPSIHLSGVSAYVFNQNGNADRVLFNFNFEKQAGVKTNGSWNAAHYLYAKQGEEDYTLVDQTNSTAGDIVYGMDGDMSNADATSGTWGLLLFYSGFGRTTGADDDGTARSFYIPKGSLYGGFNEGYGFFIDNDVYLDYNGDNTFANDIFDARHTYEKHEKRCGHPGNLEYYTCPRHANEYFVLEDGEYKATTLADVQVDIDHTPGELIPAVAKTCTTDGSIAHYVCQTCGAYLVLKDGVYEEISAEDLVVPASHEYQKVEAKAKTCTEDGYVEHYVCSDCEKIFLLEDGAYREVEATDIVIPASHNPQVVPGREATGTEDGLTEGSVCADCGAVLVEQKTIPALGHSFSEWTAYQKDDDTYAIRRVCAHCDEVETVDATEANGFTVEIVRKATTTEEGEVSLKSDKYGAFTLPIEKLQPTESNSRLSVGAIASIVAGSVLLLGAITFLVITLVRKKGKANKEV